MAILVFVALLFLKWVCLVADGLAYFLERGDFSFLIAHAMERELVEGGVSPLNRHTPVVSESEPLQVVPEIEEEGPQAISQEGVQPPTLSPPPEESPQLNRSNRLRPLENLVGARPP